MVVAPQVHAGCLTLMSGPVVVDVLGCKLIEPEQVFVPTKEKFAWVHDLDPAAKKKFLDTYRGLFLKVKVVKSQVTAQGVSWEQGTLMGETVTMFIPPSANRCDQVVGKRLGAALKEVCCEGGGAPPCLLDTSYLLASPQIMGAAGSAAGDVSRQKAKHSKDYQSGMAAAAARRWTEAAQKLERARVNGEIDVAGTYQLGLAHRELDQCPQALPILRPIYDQGIKKQIWADEEPEARKAVFLLARCLSRLNDPAGSVLILQHYLLETQKYRSEIEQSLKHRDFGYIHTSREYLDYEREARKRLGQHPTGK